MNSIKELDILLKDINQFLDTKCNTDNRTRSLCELWRGSLNKKRREIVMPYKLVFIGQKGAGKTTSIVELFGLKKTSGEKVLELLTTGGGGVTTFEVELLKSDKPETYLKIEPIDEKLFYQYVDDFCMKYVDEDGVSLPTEINRAIRNMVGLKDSEIKLLREKHKERDEFRTEILRRIGVQKRKNTIIKCDSSNGTYFESCQKTFEMVNLCKFEDVMLPKRVKIFLTKDIFDFSSYPFISSIVDTRGVDTNIANTVGVDTNHSSSPNSKDLRRRGDILRYIDTERNCLFFFMDDFLHIPSHGITELLKPRLTVDNPFRFYLFVNIKGDAAENVITDAGRAETAKEGIQYKRDYVCDVFRREIKRFDVDDNLLFYNARKNDPNNILLRIENNISKHRKRLFGHCNGVRVQFDKLKKKGDTVWSTTPRGFELLRKYVDGVGAPINTFERFLTDFITDLKGVNASVLNAVNRRDGGYAAFDFFDNIGIDIEDLFENIFARAKDNIVDEVGRLLKSSDITELDIISYRIFIEKFESDYLDGRSQLKEDIKAAVKKSFQKSSWEDATKEWGKGPGYKDRIFVIYKKELRLFAGTVDIRKEFNSAWDNILKKNALS